MDSNRSEMDMAAAGWKFNPGMGEWEPAEDYGNENLDFKLDEDEYLPGRDYDGYEIPIKVSEAMPEVKDIDLGFPPDSEKSDASFTKTDNLSFFHRQDNGRDADVQEVESEDDSEGNPKTLMRVLTRFADRTSMQGVPYINVSKVWYAKAAWALLFFIGFVAMCFHLYYLIQEYYAFRTHSVVTLGFNTLSFPAVTVCNVNPIKASQMDLASDALKSLVDSVQPSRIVSSMEEKRRPKEPGREDDKGQQPGTGGTDPNSQHSNDMGSNGDNPPDQQSQNTNNNDNSPADTNTNQNTQQPASDGGTSQTSSSSESGGSSTTNSNNNSNQGTTTRAGQSSNQNTQPPSSNQQSQSSNDNSSGNSVAGNTTTSSGNGLGTTASTDTTTSTEKASLATSETPSSKAETIPASETTITTAASPAVTTKSVASSTNSSVVVTESSTANDTQSSATNLSQSVTRSQSANDTDNQRGNDTEAGRTNSPSGNRPQAPQSGNGDNSGSQRKRRDTSSKEGKTLSRHRRFVDGFSISETNTRYQNNEDDGISAFSGNKSTLRAIEDEFKFLFTSMRSPIREEMGHQIEDMLMECTFRGIKCGLQNFKLIQTADYGNCFTVENENFVSVLGGPGDGLNLIFFLQDEEYLKGIANSLGFQVQIHQRGSMANPYEEGLSVSAGKETFVGLKQVNIERLGDPYGTCEQGDQFESNFGLVYTQKTCQQFCIQSFILQRCRCFDTEREEVYRRIDNYESLNITQPCLTMDENTCLNRVYRQVQVGTLSCDCPSPCEETLFTKSLSSKTWPTTDYATILVEYLCGILNETECQVYATKSRSDLASSFLKVVIYFEDLNYENITEEENYELFQFVSDIGGTIGLWIGLSLISFFEVLQFLYELIHYVVYVKPRQKRKIARRKRQRQQQQAVCHAIRFANDISFKQRTPALQTADSKLSRPRSIKERLQRQQVFGNSQSPNGSTSSHGDFQNSSLGPPPFEDVMKNELHLNLKADSLSEGRRSGSRFPFLYESTDDRNDSMY